MNNHGTIENFLQYEQTEKEKQNHITEITNEKLENDVKLSKWQVKTYWLIFGFALIGGIYSIISIIQSFGESTDQKIERILNIKLKTHTKIEQVSIDQSNKKTPEMK